MAENNINNVVDSLMKNMEHLVATKTVIGEVTQVGDAIIVPLVDVSFGVGAGATSNDKRNGGAGGMNAKMSPSAVLVIQNGKAKMVSVKGEDTMSKIIDMVPEVVDKVAGMLGKGGKNPEEEAMVEQAIADVTNEETF